MSDANKSEEFELVREEEGWVEIGKRCSAGRAAGARPQENMPPMTNAESHTPHGAAKNREDPAARNTIRHDSRRTDHLSPPARRRSRRALDSTERVERRDAFELGRLLSGSRSRAAHRGDGLNDRQCVEF
jgi:hypothetical protein